MLLTACAASSQSKAPSASEPVTAYVSLVEKRADALRSRDRSAFAETINAADPSLVERQLGWFDNIGKVPLSKFTLTLADAEPAGGTIAVDISSQLGDYDPAPGVQQVEWEVGFDGSEAVVVGDRGGSAESRALGSAQPWDFAQMRVRKTKRILGIFDSETWPDSKRALAELEEALDVNEQVLPYAWHDRLVAYVVGLPENLALLRDVPGGHLDSLGGMTIPVYANAQRSRIAGSRVVLLPSSLQAEGPFLGRLARHELAHVAIGRYGEGVPRWLTEGVAEWLGARPLAPDQREIPNLAVERARQPSRGLPASTSFEGKDARWNYALSWMACEYIVENFGAESLWDLLDALSDSGRGTPDDAQDEVLEQTIGMNSYELSDKAMQRIRITY